MVRPRRKKAATTPDQSRTKRSRLNDADDGLNDQSQNNDQSGSDRLLRAKKVHRTMRGEWGARLRERQQNGQSAGTQNERNEAEGELSDVDMEDDEILQTLQPVFTNLDISQLPTLSPGAGLYAMANYAIEEKSIPKRTAEKPKVPEDMLEPTFLTLEQAIQRDENFKGKLLDAFLEDFKEHFETYFSRRNSLTFDKESCSRFLHQHFSLCRTPLIELLVDEFAGRYAVAAWVCFFVESGFGFLMRRYFLHVNQPEWVVWSTPLPTSRKRRTNWLPDPSEDVDTPLANSMREFRARLARYRADYAQLFMPNANHLIPTAEDVAVYSEVPGKPLIECVVCTGQFPVSRTVCCQNILNWTITIDPTLLSESSDFAFVFFQLFAADVSHRFCIECLIGHARAATQEMPLAEGGIGLKCMASDCANAILFSDCRFYIPPTVRRQLNARILEESLGEARLNNLERCKSCNFAIIIEASVEELRVFTCQKCHAGHCRICERPWDEFHLGKPCNEVETEKEQMKRHFENKLSEAVIHRCQRCSLPFVKQMGCNRMYCRCGATQCYVCRAHNIHYGHFCQHFRNIGQTKCKQCTLPCLLWEEESRATKRAIDRVVSEAAQMGILLDLEGPSEIPKTKKS
uniref:RING-type domain-containing protein n=1 Tax=Globodera rostochiensis TaxID=31243 RepID=A0A914GS16_GLORO